MVKQISPNNGNIRYQIENLAVEADASFAIPLLGSKGRLSALVRNNSFFVFETESFATLKAENQIS